VVAIKKLRHIFDKTLITKRCLREIKLLQHFNGHPRIIDIRELDIVDHTNFNEVYLAQQCCDTTLADVIHSSQPLENVHYQWFLYQILTGVNYVHSADVSFCAFCNISHIDLSNYTDAVYPGFASRFKAW
jgi:mitogen-activated protein kinase 7